MLDRTRLTTGATPTPAHATLSDELGIETDGRLGFLGIHGPREMTVIHSAAELAEEHERTELTTALGRLADSVRSASMERGLFADPLERIHGEGVCHQFDRLEGWTLIAVGQGRRCLLAAVETDGADGVDPDTLLDVIRRHHW